MLLPLERMDLELCLCGHIYHVGPCPVCEADPYKSFVCDTFKPLATATCVRCEVLFTDAPRAPNTRLCYDCALQVDGPTDQECDL